MSGVPEGDRITAVTYSDTGVENRTTVCAGEAIDLGVFSAETKLRENCPWRGWTGASGWRGHAAGPFSDLGAVCDRCALAAGSVECWKCQNQCDLEFGILEIE